MLSLFKHWNKGKNDPNAKCSSQATDIQKKVVEQQETTDNKENTTMAENIDNKLNVNEEEPIMGNENLSVRDKIELALHTVYDPEIPVNIMELGLVYNIDIKEDNIVFITMTLTAPGCPVAGDIVLEVSDKIKAIEGVKDVHVQLTFDPQWTKDMMTDEAKLELGMF